MNGDQHLKQGQELREPWEVTYTRPHLFRRDGRPCVVARLNWPHHVSYGLSGEGNTIEEARLDLVLKLAAAVADHEAGDPESTRVQEDTLRRLGNTARRAVKRVRELVAAV